MADNAYSERGRRAENGSLAAAGPQEERHNLDLAYDGRTGFDLAASAIYDAIILDLLLPGLDGLTIAPPGGTLTLSSTVGQGTRVTLNLDPAFPA